MRSFFVAIFLYCVMTVGAAPRIIGGQNVPNNGKYPYQVSIQSLMGHWCGGSILNERWILTAAHCLPSMMPSMLKVLVGTNNLESSTGKSYLGQTSIWHEEFNLEKLVNDIGLLRVARDIEFNDKVQPIQLPSDDFSEADYPAVLTGWGQITVEGSVSNILQEIELKIIDQDKCANMTGFPISESHICTLTKAGEGACSGDSGSPLVANGTQIGIVSFGYPCALGLPDVHTRVHSYVDWIKKKISEN